MMARKVTVMLLTLLLSVAGWVAPSLANCSPEGDGSGQDIDCTGTDLDGVNAQAGEDTITVHDGALISGGEIRGGPDDDRIVIETDATVQVPIHGDTGADTIINDGDADNGFDTVNTIFGDDGDDRIINNDNGDADWIDGGAGDDTISNSGDVGDAIKGGADNDLIVNTSGGEADTMLGEGGNDRITNAGDS